MLGRKFLSTAQVAELIEVSPRTITLWAAAWQESGGQEGIPGFKFGKNWKFDPIQIGKWITAKRHSAEIAEISVKSATSATTSKTGSTG